MRWRLGGTRSGRKQRETFGAGSDARNKARAEGFREMVAAAGEFWPEGWVQGRGFVGDRAGESVGLLEVPRAVEVGVEYVDQIVDCSPGQRARYKGQLRALTAVEVRGKRGTYRPFDQRTDLVTEDDTKAWLIGWPRSPKTKANYHGLLFGVFTYAVERGEVATQPADPHGAEAFENQAVAGGPAVSDRGGVRGGCPVGRCVGGSASGGRRDGAPIRRADRVVGVGFRPAAPDGAGEQRVET
ncbi:MAG: hypothetical protein ACRDVG_00760 [Jatrophihabitantaceae bacterium]